MAVALHEVHFGRALTVRSGLIVRPHDAIGFHYGLLERSVLPIVSKSKIIQLRHNLQLLAKAFRLLSFALDLLRVREMCLIRAVPLYLV